MSREVPNDAGAGLAGACFLFAFVGNGSEGVENGKFVGNRAAGRAETGSGTGLSMQNQRFEEVLDELVADDPRYQRDAYHFVREG